MSMIAGCKLKAMYVHSVKGITTSIVNIIEIYQ